MPAREAFYPASLGESRHMTLGAEHLPCIMISGSCSVLWKCAQDPPPGLGSSEPIAWWGKRLPRIGPPPPHPWPRRVGREPPTCAFCKRPNPIPGRGHSLWLPIVQCALPVGLSHLLLWSKNRLWLLVGSSRGDRPCRQVKGVPDRALADYQNGGDPGLAFPPLCTGGLQKPEAGSHPRLGLPAQSLRAPLEGN